MTRLLRQTAQITKLSHNNLQLAYRARNPSLRPSLIPRNAYNRPIVRRYATKPPEEQNDDKKKTPDGQDAKPAPGMEHLYGKSSPMSSSASEKTNPTTAKDKPKTKRTSRGEQKQEDATSDLEQLTTAEKARLDQVVEQATKGMPAFMANSFREIVAELKTKGVPKSRLPLLREAMAGDLTPALAVRLRRFLITNAWTRMKGEVFGNETSSKGEQKSAEEPGPSTAQEKQTSGDKKKMQGPTEIKLDLTNLLLSLFLTWFIWWTLVPTDSSREITWQELRSAFLDKGLVEKLVVLNNSRVKVHLHREAVASMYPESPAAQPNFYYYFTIGSVEAFERKADQAQAELGVPSSERIPVQYAREVPWMDTFMSFAPTLLLIGGVLFMSRKAGSGGGMGGGVFGMGRSRARKFNHETDVKVKFSDVAGMDEAKQEIMEFVSFLRDPGMYQKLGAKIPRGAILSGPPGTGKTLLAKATAGESGVPFFSVSGSEFVEMFVGVGASRVRDLFQNARKSTPCIIFIDEIDAIGKARSKSGFGGGNDEREATLNQILTEMDGFNTSEQVVVLAGTNRADVLDKALMRPGRFDRHIAIDPPTMEGRKHIFKVHLKKIVTHVDTNYLEGRLAALTPGFSGADIANCVNEAALIAARHNAASVLMTHFEQAIERVIGGLEKRSLVLAPDEKRTVAYHEAGHAICGWYFQWADPLLKVSIIPRGSGALGYAQYLPGDAYLLSANQLMDRMAMALGGRVSEELHFATVTSGASDDFNKVTRMATAMVTKWGMSPKIGYRYYEDDNQQSLHKPFSEDTARDIDAEVRRIVDEAYQQCKALLTEKKEQVGVVAEELLRKEMLTRDDMIRLLGRRPFPDKAEFSKYFDGGKGEGPAETICPSPESDTKDHPLPPPVLPGGNEPSPAPTVFDGGDRARL